MKKVLILLSLLVTSVFASTGADIFKAKCVSCHVQTTTNMQNEDMKAPAMNMVSMRLKHKLDSKDAFVTFINDYIQDPSKDKGLCMPRAYKRFGVMPPIGKTMTLEERKTIASWIYDNFNGSWEKSMGGKMCKKNNKEFKYSNGKCGGSQNSSMKCGSGKCGGSQNSSMKCGSK